MIWKPWQPWAGCDNLSGPCALNPAFDCISNICLAGVSEGETPSWTNSRWSFCPVQSQWNVHLLGGDWGFSPKACWKGAVTICITEISLCFSSPLCCVPYKHEASLLLCRARKSPEQTLQKLGCKPTVCIVPARISARVSRLSRDGRRSGGLFASWHRSSLSQSLPGCC